jgi:hypothetical protein
MNESLDILALGGNEKNDKSNLKTQDSKNSIYDINSPAPPPKRKNSKAKSSFPVSHGF